MPRTATHIYNNANADSGNTNQTLPSDWNRNQPFGDLLTNKTGGTLNVGDVVGPDTGNDEAVVLRDTVTFLGPLYVTLGTVNSASDRTQPVSVTNNSTGLFCNYGEALTLCQGTVTRGNYLRKSATTKALEDTGVSANGNYPPAGTVAVALQGGTTTTLQCLWLGLPTRSPGAAGLTFTGISTPSTPASGDIVLYSASGTPLKKLSVVDSGGQTRDLSEVLFRSAGNPFKDVNTTAAETSVYSSTPTIKGNTLGTNRLLRIIVLGDVLNNTGASRGFTLKFKYGATTFANIVGTGWFASGATRFGWKTTALLAAIGATNAQYGNTLGEWAATANVTGTLSLIGFGGTNPWGQMTTHTTVAEDSTADKSFDLTITPEVNNANLSIRVFYIIGELL